MAKLLKDLRSQYCEERTSMIKDSVPTPFTYSTYTKRTILQYKTWYNTTKSKRAEGFFKVLSRSISDLYLSFLHPLIILYN